MTDEPTTAAGLTRVEAYLSRRDEIGPLTTSSLLYLHRQDMAEARREGAAEVLAAVERLRRPRDDWPIDPPGLGGTWDLGYRSGWADAVDDAVAAIEAERKKAAETA